MKQKRSPNELIRIPVLFRIPSVEIDSMEIESEMDRIDFGLILWTLTTCLTFQMKREVDLFPYYQTKTK